MSDQETGSKDRATVALVGAEVREVKAIIEGHAKLTAQSFKDMGRRLATLDALPAQMAALHERQTLSEARLLILEKRDDKSSEWRRGPLFTALVAFGCTLVSALTTLGVLLLSHHL